VHQILEMGLTLRREGELLQPVFYCEGFDLVERTLTPLLRPHGFHPHPACHRRASQ
jgi:hypothetical protein